MMREGGASNAVGRQQTTGTPLLAVRNLRTEIDTDEGIIVAVNDVSLDLFGGRGAGRRRRVGVRQDDAGPVDPRPAGGPGPDRGRRGATGGGGPAVGLGAAPPAGARRGDCDDLPGSADGFEPGAARGGPDRRDDQGPSAGAQDRGPSPGRGSARARRHPRCRPAGPLLSPRAVGRDATAGDDRHGHSAGPRRAHRRRADDRSGRDRAGPGAGGPVGIQAAHVGGHDDHQP